MVRYTLVYASQAKRDAKKAKAVGLKDKILTLLEIITENPYQNPPPHERLVGDRAGANSRRINIQYRLVYQVYEQERMIKLLRLWSHYA